ncbi:MAG: hypothetical protein JWL84_5300 [Rhodospirillales bacterium]|jgi:hypothetical protein|nr:hypothetical protein [Rhodospirillales bacterium]
MRKFLLAAVAAASLTSGYATAQQFYSAPLDPSRVDRRDLIVQSDDKNGNIGTSGPQDYSKLSDRDLQRKANQLATQQQQLRAEQQAVADETARRANR